MPPWDPKTAVILVDHGSRRPEANAMLDAVAQLYARQAGVPIVEPAHMELAPPSIAEAFARCVARGATTVVVAQYFLSPGRHSRSDIPALVAEAAAAHPGVAWRISEPLGIDPRLADVLHARVTEALCGPLPGVAAPPPGAP
jgi:sirohydrochlorin ferrochelatase